MRGDPGMRAPDQDLIKGLKERNADRERATDGHIHPRKPIPPVTTKDLRDAERALGFQLPDLVRAIYRKVANGGFGPVYGVVGTKGGFKLDKYSLESCYQGMLQLEQVNSIWRWPQRLLPLANYGCGMWSCVDCEYKKLSMIIWDPNILDSTLDGADARLELGQCVLGPRAGAIASIDTLKKSQESFQILHVPTSLEAFLLKAARNRSILGVKQKSTHLLSKARFSWACGPCGRGLRSSANTISNPQCKPFSTPQ